VNWGANWVGAKPRPTVIYVLHMTIVMCKVIYICDRCGMRTIICLTCDHCGCMRFNPRGYSYGLNLNPICIARGHVVAMCPRALVVKSQRLTIRQFVLVVWLHPILGFNT
jgi:hypothetical protein